MEIHNKCPWKGPEHTEKKCIWCEFYCEVDRNQKKIADLEKQIKHHIDLHYCLR